MKALVEYLVREIVAQPDSVEIREEPDRNGVVYLVHVDPSDVGRVIGKGGKVANSLRALVKAAASKGYERASVEIATE